MKKRILSLFLTVSILSIFLVGCSKDKDNDPFADFYGNWEIIKYGAYNANTGAEVDVTIEEDAPILIINKDGSGIFLEESELLTWKNPEYPSHVTFDGYYFNIKKLSSTDILLLSDPEIGGYISDEGLIFGIHLRKAIPR